MLNLLREAFYYRLFFSARSLERKLGSSVDLQARQSFEQMDVSEQREVLRQVRGI